MAFGEVMMGCPAFELRENGYFSLRVLQTQIGFRGVVYPLYQRALIHERSHVTPTNQFVTHKRYLQSPTKIPLKNK